MQNAEKNAITDKDAADAALKAGLLTGLAAYVLWGAMPIYLKALNGVSALEILCHRIFWSVPFGALIVTTRRQWREVFAALRDKRVLWMLALSALAISLNWLIYVWAVVNERIIEASLGYYINPLMYVAAGVFILGERLRTAQIVAVCLAAAGVAVLTVGAGVFPIISLSLAVLFTAYGYIRKTTNVGAMPGLFIEVLLLSPMAFVYVLWLMQAGEAAFLNGAGAIDVLLVLAGPVTVVPLVMFALAARRLRLTTLGLLQYITPTLQLLLGVYFGETFTLYHAVCFGLIWSALAIYSGDAFRENRRKVSRSV
ncbi:EamA family transporter RarD [Hyphococcus sp.]|uniref:EamA family transporter RarD n=1 Tax=Hyphococcus sp. TaxID=2038636 RepID=UPI003CCBAED3